MEENRKKCILFKILGSLLILIGIVFLFIKATRQYIPILESRSFELFMISPIFIILGVKAICKDIKLKIVNVFSDVLLGLAIIYFVVLSAGWYSINIM